MANKTTNYGLTKPLPEEFYDVNVQNTNMEIIDRKMKELENKVPEVEVTPEGIGAAPMYTYGTTDLEAGVSALDTGKLHFVYE